ncbi:hypothetical protein B566_EDAN007436 [Ephemera danica]|nr:hypothetical protein B566_EDAN007436 [Ephemera danica]
MVCFMVSANTHGGTRRVRETTYAPPRSEYYAPPAPPQQVYYPPPTPIYHATRPPLVYEAPAPTKLEYAPPPPTYKAPTAAYEIPAPPKPAYKAPTQEYGVPVEDEFLMNLNGIKLDSSFAPAVEPEAEPIKEDSFSEDVHTEFSNVDVNKDFTPDEDLEAPETS